MRVFHMGKNRFRVLSLFLLIILAAGWGCGDTDEESDESTSDLVGFWTLSEFYQDGNQVSLVGVTKTLQFCEDWTGNAFQEVAENAEIQYSEDNYVLDFIWSIEGDTLVVEDADDVLLSARARFQVNPDAYDPTLRIRRVVMDRGMTHAIEEYYASTAPE